MLDDHGTIEAVGRRVNRGDQIKIFIAEKELLLYRGGCYVRIVEAHGTPDSHEWIQEALKRDPLLGRFRNANHARGAIDDDRIVGDVTVQRNDGHDSILNRPSSLDCRGQVPHVTSPQTIKDFASWKDSPVFI